MKVGEKNNGLHSEQFLNLTQFTS